MSNSKISSSSIIKESTTHTNLYRAKIYIKGDCGSESAMTMSNFIYQINYWIEAVSKKGVILPARLRDGMT